MGAEGIRTALHKWPSKNGTNGTFRWPLLGHGKLAAIHVNNTFLKMSLTFRSHRNTAKGISA